MIHINNNTILLIALSLFLILLGGIFKKKKKQRKSTSYNHKITPIISESQLEKKSDHLDLAMKHHYKRKPLMNYSEFQLFKALNQLLTHSNYQEFRLFSQVSMGEFIEAEERSAHFAINNKRVDFLIIDKKGYPVIVIEYQGEGHYQENAAKRDAVKREACRKAGVLFFEFFPHYGKSELQLIKDGLTRYLNTK